MKKKKRKMCKAYCKNGAPCPNGATFFDYCIPHYHKYKEDQESWEIVQAFLADGRE